MSLLCETVTGQTMAELTAARDAVTAADMIELRLDGVADADVARALQERRLPVVVTCRPVWEGGRFAGDEQTRRQLLEQALALGADYVDIEWKAGFDDLIQQHPSRVVVSSHDFSGVPPDLCDRVRAMRTTGASMIKVAITAHRLSDTLPLLEIARDKAAVVIGMGDAGVPSRLLAARFGSRWTYAGNAVAPGQMPAERMVHEFRFRSIGPQTAIYGAVGEGVMTSHLPMVLNQAFGAAGLDAACIPLAGADAEDVQTFSEALGLAGVVRTA